jgi:hypothetical protein
MDQKSNLAEVLRLTFPDMSSASRSGAFLKFVVQSKYRTDKRKGRLH